MIFVDSEKSKFISLIGVQQRLSLPFDSEPQSGEWLIDVNFFDAQLHRTLGWMSRVVVCQLTALDQEIR